MSLPHRFGRCHRCAARPAAAGWLIADERLTPDEQLRDMAREELVKNPHAKPTNTRIGSGQCGYLHFTCRSLGWREISGRLGGCGVLPQKPSCRHVDEPKRPRTKQVGLATKRNNGHSTENSEEPDHLRAGALVMVVELVLPAGRMFSRVLMGCSGARSSLEIS